MLCDYVSKYAIDDSYVEAVTRRSEGNPLFIKMLCEALAGGSLPLNDLARLPHSIDNLYDELIRRLRGEERVFDLLLLLSVALDYLSAETVSRITGWTVPQTEDAIDNAMEVLFENPFTADVLDYQLFHQSLRDYLTARYPQEISRWNEVLAQWCGRWSEMASESRDYAVKYGVRHLEQSYEAGNEPALQTICDRVQDAAFRESQFASAGLQPVLDDLLRAARLVFFRDGRWQSSLALLLLHAQEARRLQAAEITRLRQVAQAGDVTRLLNVLRREPDGLARFVATALGAWELADAGHPCLEVLQDLKDIPNVGLSEAAAQVFRGVFASLETHGLTPADAEGLLDHAMFVPDSLSTNQEPS
jgi:hypothetical protein